MQCSAWPGSSWSSRCAASWRVKGGCSRAARSPRRRFQASALAGGLTQGGHLDALQRLDVLKGRPLGGGQKRIGVAQAVRVHGAATAQAWTLPGLHEVLLLQVSKDPVGV